MVNLFLKSYTFCLYFIPYLHVWIRIRIRNRDPDVPVLSSWIRIKYGSAGSTTQGVRVPYAVPDILMFGDLAELAWLVGLVEHALLLDTAAAPVGLLHSHTPVHISKYNKFTIYNEILYMTRNHKMYLESGKNLNKSK